jgi:A/G-specific adenine glycosylase
LLLRWYDQHRRHLPWRAAPGVAPEPYHVWLSEIMLQQTTVATVGPYYQRFLRRWPTLKKLAAAPLEDVLQEWAGLGYYSRARNLHKCAQAVAGRGDFPRTEKELLALPGIGPYTAAAITAIAFDQPANVVDGNVERVMSRLFALATPLPALKAKVREVATPLVPQKRAGDYAQALMDLGATICTPRSPKCTDCPLQKHCLSYEAGNAETFPRRAAKKARPVKQGIAFIVTDAQGKIWLRRRPPTGLLGGMLEIPSSSWNPDVPTLADALELEPELPPANRWRQLPGEVRHVFSHFELRLTLWHTRSTKRLSGQWLSPSAAATAGLPSLMHKILSTFTGQNRRAA